MNEAAASVGTFSGHFKTIETIQRYSICERDFDLFLLVF